METSTIEREGINPTNESSSSNTKVQKTNDGNIDKKGEAKISIPFYRLFAFADSTDILLMILGSIGAVANGLALPLMTVIFGNLIQSFGGAMSTHDVVHRVSKVSLEYVYLAIGAGLASCYQVSCWMATGERQAARIRNLYLKTILQQEIAFFDKETKTGEVVGRMSGDTVLIQDAMGEKVGMFIQLVSTFLGGYVVAFIRGWLLTLVMLSMVPVVALAGAAVGGAITKMASAGQTANAEAAVVVEQTIGSIRTVASFTGEERSIERYKKSLQKAYESSVVEGLVSGLGIGAVMLIMFCGYGLGIWYGSKLILNNGYTGGDVINVIFAVLTGSFSLGQASPCLQAFAAGQAAAHKMFETINRKPEIDASDPKGRKPDNIVGDIEFKDVHFSYPTRQEELIFKGFSLCIQHGSTVALVGESGSGKSTAISLIERFYDPQAGEVLIDNINLKEFQLNWIRGKIGLVSQDPVLFASSIRDNIAYGKDGATNEEINAAAELANASKFINKLPQGLDTLVGEHGTQLSGGQKQRVAIARAILKDPRILLLDEATSALDAKSERTVQEALDRVMANRTTVIVAHRLSTICNADTIAVLHKGTIVEKGSHSDLLTDPNGAYSRLIHLQEINQNTDCSSQFDKFELSPSPDIQRDYSTSPRRSPILNNLQESKQEQSNNKIKAQQIDEVSIHRLAGLNKPEIPVLILGTLAAVVNGILFPAFGVLLSSAINTFYQAPDKLKKDSEFWSILFVMFGCISIVILPARAYFFGVAGAKLIRRIRLMTFKKVVHMEVAWFDDPENSNGAIGARLSADPAQVKGLLGDALSLVVQNITTLVAGLVIAFLANWQLAMIILALIPVIGLEGYIQVKFLKGFSANAKMMYEEASQIANDAVGNIRTVASFSAEDKVMELYKKKCEGPTRTGIKRGLVSGIGVGSSFFLLFCFFAVSFYAGALLIQDGKTTFGKVFRVFFALSMAAIGISQSSSLAPDFIKAKSATASVFGILDHKCLIDASEDSGMKAGKVNGDIEFMHVSFKYPSRPDVLIIQDLCLSIQAGKTVALVGESGSGKSTVISLLQRFYDPDSGHILIDGIELPKYSVKWLRQQMGLVSQEPTLFNDTIRANIAYGKEDEATEAEIVGAATSANAHKFISSLQQGYDTLVGERGIQLSGGQKQRVAIARVILKEPKILLLDEATSALDAESERAVQDALDQVMVNRTTIVIAHRLSTIRGADVIAVVKNGMIIEKGEHDFLLNIKKGVYASLVALHSGNA